MTDIINLNSIRSDNCNCNKPKPLNSCGCNGLHNYPVINFDDLYFKVKNLFGELKSEWQRAEARSNLGITDIIDLKLIKFGEGSGDSNIWQMEVSKGGSKRLYDFVVKNGLAGESATIDIARVYALEPEAQPQISNIGTPTHAIYNIGIPKGKQGESITGPKGERGKSAYEVYKDNNPTSTLTEPEWLLSLQGSEGPKGDSAYEVYKKNNPTSNLTEALWLESLKGNPGTPGTPGDDGKPFKYEDFTPEQLESLRGPAGPASDKIVFMFKCYDFKKVVTPRELYTYTYEVLWGIEVNVREQHIVKGKVPEILRSDYGWSYNLVPQELNGERYIFMAITSISPEGDVMPWTVLPLNGIPGPCCNEEGGGDNPDNPDNPDTPDNPIIPGTESHGCLLKIYLKDTFREEDPSNHSGVVVPYSELILTAHNDSAELKTFRIPDLLFLVYYEPGDTSDALHTYTLGISDILFELNPGQSIIERVELTTGDREKTIGGGSAYYDQSDDNSGYFSNFELNHINDGQGSELPNSVVTIEPEEFPSIHGIITCNSYEIVNLFSNNS